LAPRSAACRCPRARGRAAAAAGQGRDGRPARLVGRLCACWSRRRCVPRVCAGAPYVPGPRVC
jgi:hypothetical protein